MSYATNSYVLCDLILYGRRRGTTGNQAPAANLWISRRSENPPRPPACVNRHRSRCAPMDATVTERPNLRETIRDPA